jgi:uncharacterized protein
MRYRLLIALAASFVLAAVLAMTACSSKSDSVDDFYLRRLTLPDGRTMRVEAAFDNVALLRGLMFRSSLEPDRGMLFVYPRPDHYQTVMYQVRIPLDIIWMDSGRRIVQIDANAPPCETQASKCQKYGGAKVVAFALEIGGGMARKYGLETGQILQW